MTLTNKRMASILHRYEITVDTMLSLKGFEHSDKHGWLNDASIVNDWTMAVMNFTDMIEEFSQSEVTSQFESLRDYAEVDILKNLLMTY